MRLVLLFMMILAVVGPQPALAGPPSLPSSFYGIVKIDRANVPAGITVTALIDGVEYAHSTVAVYQGNSVTSLDVPADDPGTPVKEGGAPGDVVHFRVGNQMMLQTAPWRSGVNLHLDLTLFHANMPAVVRGTGY
jgi:hypothetical protein